MTTPKETLTPLESLKKTHENIVIFLGVAIGVILIGYFFTFAMLTDKGSRSGLWFEGLSSVAMVLILVKIKWVAWQLMRLFMARKAKYSSVLKGVSLSDL